MHSNHSIGDLVADRYRILGTLGEGGCGTTYRAKDQDNGHIVALKVLSFNQTRNWKNIELIEREAQVLDRIDHPAIPSYVDYFQIDSENDCCFYLVQQLAEGQTLASLVESGWRSSEPVVRDIALQLLDILIYLHGQSPAIIHRDLKPENIIRNTEGQLFLVDFGAVQDAYQSTFLRRSTVVGTFGYMAPEQFQGQAVPSSDLYGLGATLLYLLTHRSPAELPVERLKIKFRDRISLSDSFADWLEILLEPDIKDRFRSARAALTFLEKNHRKKTPKQESLRPSLFFVGLGAVAIAAIAGIAIYRYPILNTFGFTANIHSSIDAGDLDLHEYLAAGGNLHGRDRQGRTLLHTAAKMGRLDLAQQLIEKGVEVNTPDKSGLSPLHYAPSIAMVKFLLANGADINAQSTRGRTLLHRAVTQDEVALIKVLIAAGAEVNKGNSPLHAAETEETAALLIANDADPRQLDRKGSTFLHKAVKKQWHQSLITLAEKGTDFNITNKDGLTPLYLAATDPTTDIAASLIEWGAKFSDADKKRYQQDNLHPVRISAHQLFAGGFDVNIRDSRGNTLLHRAIFDQPLDDIRFLIAQGADVNAKNNDHTTPLAILENFHREQRLEISRLLIEAGAEINPGDSLLRRAVKEGNTPFVRSLIANGIDTEREQGSELIAAAVYSGNPSLLKTLIKAGFKVNPWTDEGATLLHRLNSDPPQRALSEISEVIDILIAEGIDINSRDENGSSPLQKVLEHRRVSPALVSLLIQKGADVNFQNNQATMPLQQAQTKEIRELLIAAGATRHFR